MQPVDPCGKLLNALARPILQYDLSNSKGHVFYYAHHRCEFRTETQLGTPYPHELRDRDSRPCPALGIYRHYYRDVQNYLQEIIQHLTAVDGSHVELTLEVEVTAPDGIPSTTIRTVSENCRTLKVTDFGFDD